MGDVRWVVNALDAASLAEPVVIEPEKAGCGPDPALRFAIMDR